MYKPVLLSTICFFTFILYVIYKADTGQQSLLFDFVKATPYGDKIGHLVLFGLLTLGVNISTQFKVITSFKTNIYLGTFIVSLFVITEELTQFFSPTRTLDILDLCADSVGILIATAIAYAIKKIIGQSLP